MGESVCETFFSESKTVPASGDSREREENTFENGMLSMDSIINYSDATGGGEEAYNAALFEQAVPINQKQN